MDRARSTITARDGATIAYELVDGADPAVLILHGLAGSSREWVATARALAPRAVALVDQRGHGASTRRPDDVSRAAFVDDIARVIDALGRGPIDLVGQSMGAHTAMLVAAAHPEAVRRLVLLEGNEGGGTAAEHAAIGDYFRAWEVPFDDRAAARRALGDGPLGQAWVADLEQRPDGLYPRFEPDVMQRAITAVGVPRWAEWESVTAPTLVVYAEHGMFEEAKKVEFVRRGRNATRVDLEDASHDAHLDAHESWMSALRSFLEAR